MARIADIVTIRVPKGKPEYVPSVQAVLRAQANARTRETA